MHSAEVMHQTRLTYRRLDYLVSEKCIPDRRQGQGSGSYRNFEQVDIEVAAVLGRMGELVGSGMNPKSQTRSLKLWRYTSKLLYSLDRPWPNSWFVWEVGDSPYIEENLILPCIKEAALIIRLPPYLVPSES